MLKSSLYFYTYYFVKSLTIIIFCKMMKIVVGRDIVKDEEQEEMRKFETWTCKEKVCLEKKEKKDTGGNENES